MEKLTLDTVYDAKNVLSKIARTTSLTHSNFLSGKNNVYLKSENLQLTGSFKLRGAYYNLYMAQYRFISEGNWKRF